jgi:hypothetical protein
MRLPDLLLCAVSLATGAVLAFVVATQLASGLNNCRNCVTFFEIKGDSRSDEDQRANQARA